MATIDITNPGADLPALKSALNAITRVPGYCLVTKSADQTAQNLSATVNLTFDTDASDADGLHSTVSNTDQLVIPASWNGRLIEVGCHMHLSSVTATSSAYLGVLRGGATFVGDDSIGVNVGAYTDARLNVRTAPIIANTGDVYTFQCHCSDTSVTIEAEDTYAWARIVD